MRRPAVFLGIGIVLSVFFIWIYLPVITKYRELKIQEETMALEIQELEEKVQFLEEERELLRTDVTYLERVIRREMGLVRPGETVYKLIEEEIFPR